MTSRLKVLILHNIPQSGAASVCRESDEGVLAEVRAVQRALAGQSYDFRTLGIEQLSDLPAILEMSEEGVVLNLVEGLCGNVFDPCLVPAICRAYGKACTGSDTMCLMAALDKWRTKALLRAAGLQCPAGPLVGVGEGLPAQFAGNGAWIVKPALSDASEGISAASVVIDSRDALEKAVAHVHKQSGQAAMVEEYIEGRELNVSILQQGDRVEALPIAEINFDAFGQGQPKIVCYRAKWQADTFEYANTPRVIPAKLSPREEEDVRAVALAAWKALGCSDYIRVDLRLDAQGTPFILEVNPNPDISPEAGFACALEAAEIPFNEFVAALVANAGRRGQRRASSREEAAGSSPDNAGGINIRETRADDVPAILGIIERTGCFRRAEIEVAREVLCHAIAGYEDEHYHSLVAERGRTILGWVCFGEASGTAGTFDIYWIAISPESHRRGIGRRLLSAALDGLRKAGGRLAIVETSSRPDYAPARSFYEKSGFAPVSRISDYYVPGDDQIIYAMTLSREDS